MVFTRCRARLKLQPSYASTSLQDSLSSSPKLEIDSLVWYLKNRMNLFDLLRNNTLVKDQGSRIARPSTASEAFTIVVDIIGGCSIYSGRQSE